ncbi:MAG: hypothetical protein VX839_09405, partial [Verrucomicrobiota bacterium]|nr:hypothetical protein [Verrucomicrobiota bacterium]
LPVHARTPILSGNPQGSRIPRGSLSFVFYQTGKALCFGETIRFTMSLLSESSICQASII